MSAEEDAIEASNKYASRKFLLALLIVSIGTGLDQWSVLSPQLVDLLKWIAGLYFGFNVTQKAAEWIASAVLSKGL